MKLTRDQKRRAVWAIRLMRTRRRNPQRLRNFIRINYRVEYTIGHCRRIWEVFKRARIGV